MIVIATRFIPFSTLSNVSMIIIWESSQWLGQNIVECLLVNKLQERMDKGSKHHRIKQSVNHKTIEKSKL